MINFKQFISLDEGFNLNKDNKVTHDDHPATKKFTSEYVKGHKGDHRQGGPTAADEKHSDNFHTNYDYKHTRSGFAGGGTTVYTHKKTGEKFKVDRNPTGKGFYGTQHHVTKGE